MDVCTAYNEANEYMKLQGDLGGNNEALPLRASKPASYTG